MKRAPAVMVEVRVARLRCAVALGLAAELLSGLGDLGLEVEDDAELPRTQTDHRRVISAFEVERFELPPEEAKRLERRFDRSVPDQQTLTPDALQDLVDLAGAALGKHMKPVDPSLAPQPVWAEVYHAATVAPLPYTLAVYDDDDADRQLALLAAALGLTDRIDIRPPSGWNGYGDPLLGKRS